MGTSKGNNYKGTKPGRKPAGSMGREAAGGGSIFVQHRHQNDAKSRNRRDRDRASGCKTLLLDPCRPWSRGTQCITYNTHKSGKPEKSETQKKTFPSILFLRIAGVLPIAINGICMSCVEKRRFPAISQWVDVSNAICSIRLTCAMNRYIL